MSFDEILTFQEQREFFIGTQIIFLLALESLFVIYILIHILTYPFFKH